MIGSPAGLGALSGLTLIGSFGPSGLSTPIVKTQRGNISYDQIRLIDRQGNANAFQMYNPAVVVASGDTVVFDGDGNLIDAGGPPAIWVAAPAHHNSTGTPTQQAYDGSGNFYFCIAANSWIQIGPGGWSNSF